MHYSFFYSRSLATKLFCLLALLVLVVPLAAPATIALAQEIDPLIEESVIPLENNQEEKEKKVKEEKINICHKTGNTWQFMDTPAGPSLDGHIGHGDFLYEDSWGEGSDQKCIEHAPPVDLCPNDTGIQTTTPCPSQDVCPNIEGIQTNPQDCPAQPGTGNIEITKYVCPSNFVPNRNDNGVGDAIPENCVPQSGIAFGYVHGTQTDAAAPYPELSESLTPGGVTNGNGVLTISNLQATGRYLIKEIDGTNLLGLYCQGDGDANPNNNDNQELTFVPENGTTKCVAYNKVTTTPVDMATISAKKIVCNSEDDLPNWGNNGADITASTAADFLTADLAKDLVQDCHLEAWDFQWSLDNVGNPGDNNVATSIPNWNNFSSTQLVAGTASVPVGRIWVREVFDADYIPFTGQNVDQTISAELYCGSDVLHYDNWEYIDTTANTTYHCVAFNVPIVQPVLTSDVTMCKENASIPDSDGFYPMPGWTLTLTGELVENLVVNANNSAGQNTANSLMAGVSYIAKSMGTWLNQGGANPVDTEYSTTDSWATHMDGYTGYSTDILELQINNKFDVDGSNWGAYNSAHTYAQSFIPSSNGTANFRIFDGTGTTQNESWFGDNSGSLSVNLYKGYAGITQGFDTSFPGPGCVLFTDVPYGTYVAGEIMQDGWENVSGLGTVVVDDPTEKFTILNQQVNSTPTTLKVHIYKYIQDGNTITQVPNDSLAPSFPMISSWDASNLGAGSGSYVLGNYHGGASFKYSADTSPMNAPANYTTSEVTSTESNFLPIGASCVEGKYRLVGYKSGTTLGEAQGAALSPTAPIYTDITTDRHIIVVNEMCPEDIEVPTQYTLTITTNGDGEGKITGDGINCDTNFEGEGSNDCSETYNEGTTVDLTVSVDEGSTFNGSWSTVIGNPGNCTGTTTSCTVNMTANTTLNAHFGISNNSGNRGGGGSSKKKSSSGTPEVLGAAACTEYITSYIKLGAQNDSANVMRLQTFLNEYLKLALVVDGIYGPKTFAAVKQFQIKEAGEVLNPWIGVTIKDKIGTGWVYKTTKRWINMIKCPELNIPQFEKSQLTIN